MALALGKTVAELLDDLGENELSGWLAYNNNVEPIPSPWTQTALICSTVANANPWDKRRYKLDDFLPIRRSKQVVDPETLHKQFLSTMAFLGKRIVPANENHAD